MSPVAHVEMLFLKCSEVTGYEMEPLLLPNSQTARSFLVMWIMPALINFYQCSGPCNQREPICSGWLLIWPWPPASGLFCPSSRFGPGSHLEREKPSLKGSHTTSVTERSRKVSLGLCANLLVVILPSSTQVQ